MKLTHYLTIAFALTCFILIATPPVHAQQTQVKYLSGTGMDNTVDWEFWVSGGRQSGEWTTIPVPSNWEMQGFGSYRYYDDWSNEPAPDSIAHYKYQFDLPDWNDKRIDIVFGGSMTDTEVKINGQTAGEVHQGGFYEFRYDVTELLNPDQQNQLEVTVRKFSKNMSVNRAERQADYWLFGGIFRPVWLEARPQQHLKHTALDAKHTGEFSAEISLQNITSANLVTGQIYTLDGNAVEEKFSTPIQPGTEQVTLKTRVSDIQQWSAEWPHRYRAEIKLENNETVVHEISETFGFRTIEVRPKDGLYVNNRKVVLKGVNRHSFWPTSGRTTSKDLSRKDVHLLKDMNMNAVRMSHYPPDDHFLEMTDSLGLYVIDELAGWQASYDSAAGAPLVKELVERDLNHPSVILWANGNEGGWNWKLDNDFGLYDPQNRTVIHPWENMNGINTSHYEIYDCCANWFFHGDDLFMPTEFLHGLYDGGHGAGLNDWWNLMLDSPLTAGAFLWSFADEGIVREDEGDSIDVAWNSAPDGILGPYREKEGSFYTIKEIWSPIYFPQSEQDNLPPTFTGALRVENRYEFTDLSDVSFEWQLVNFPGPSSGVLEHAVEDEGTVSSGSILPGETDTLFIELPETWQENDAFYLSATDPHGREIYTWSWMIPEPGDAAQKLVIKSDGPVTGEAQDGIITLSAGNTSVEIDSATGRLKQVHHEGETIPLTNGPNIISGTSTITELTHGPDGDTYVVEAAYEGNLRHVTWKMLPGGWLLLDYSYHHSSHTEKDYLGVSFDFPEDQVTGIKWLGKGPYRVWKNRLKGVEFNVWQKDYNDAITGWRWEYPEFKGFHDDVYWATLQTTDIPITMVFASDNLFLRLFTPADAPDPSNTKVEFPEGDLSFLHGIAPIGTKFYSPDKHGPAGQKNLVPGHGRTYFGSVYFKFGTPASE